MENVLLILDESERESFDFPTSVKGVNLYLKTIDYERYPKYMLDVRRMVQENKIDYVLFSRNDQVYGSTPIGEIIRKLRTGYCSFSGIDHDEAGGQAEICFSDFIHRSVKLDFLPTLRSVELFDKDWKGSFSLIFDVEQLGGVRFGLPRIIDLLHEYSVNATFFITNIIQRIYPNIVEELATRNHEIGIHGDHHEYLSGLPENVQTAKIRKAKTDLNNGYHITGANFIYRMDDSTIRSLVKNRFKYFISFLQHHYFPFSYQRLPNYPFLFSTADGNIWMVPVSVETYNRSWPVIRNMIESTVTEGRQKGFPHVIILLHPFRDGSKKHLGTLEKMILHLIRERSLRPLKVSEAISRFSTYRPKTQIYYSLDWPQDSFRSKIVFNKFHKNLGNIYLALIDAGHRPSISSFPNRHTSNLAILPYLPPGSHHQTDLTFVKISPKDVGTIKRIGDHTVKTGNDFVAICPKDKLRFLGFIRLFLPFSSLDLSGFFYENTARIVKRVIKFKKKGRLSSFLRFPRFFKKSSSSCQPFQPKGAR